MYFDDQSVVKTVTDYSSVHQLLTDKLFLQFIIIFKPTVCGHTCAEYCQM